MAAQGVKIAAKDLDKAVGTACNCCLPYLALLTLSHWCLQVAGLPLTVAHHDYELEVLKKDAVVQLKATLNAVRTVEEGVCVQVPPLLASNPSTLTLCLSNPRRRPLAPWRL